MCPLLWQNFKIYGRFILVKRLLILSIALFLFLLFDVLSVREAVEKKEEPVSYPFYVNKNIEKSDPIVLEDNDPGLNVGILVVIEANNTSIYTRALDSLRCYSQIHDYSLITAYSHHFHKKCHQQDKFFRRHCVIHQFLPKFDYLLFLDADIGVVNPKRKIEEWINPEYDVTFYDRFYNQEIMAGSMLLKNSAYSLDFIKGFADYEYKLPKSFHGTDNGALHAYVASKIFPDRPEEYQFCIEVYNKSKNYDDLFIYESCIRAVMGVQENFGNIRILRKGSGWARDNWITNSLWSPESDFMMHLWKQPFLLKYNNSDLPIQPTHDGHSDWFDPIRGSFDFNRCIAGNTTWNYDENLITTTDIIDEALKEFKAETVRDFYQRLAKIHEILRF